MSHRMLAHADLLREARRAGVILNWYVISYFFNYTYLSIIFYLLSRHPNHPLRSVAALRILLALPAHRRAAAALVTCLSLT